MGELDFRNHDIRTKLKTYRSNYEDSVPVAVLMVMGDLFHYNIERSVTSACLALYSEDSVTAEYNVHNLSSVIRIFIGCYLDSFGYSGKEIRLLCAELDSILQTAASPIELTDNQINALTAATNKDPIPVTDPELQALAVIKAVYAFLIKRQDEFEKHRCLRSDKPVQFYDNIYTNRDQMFRHTPYILEEQLVKAVALGDEKAAVKVLKEINSLGTKAVLSPDPLRSAKNSVICTCVFLARASIQAGVAADMAFALSDAVICHIEEYRRREAVLNYEEDILLQFIDLVRKNLQTRYSPPVQRTLHYIDAHLDEKIALAAIAEYVNVHPCYLSSRFNKEMKMSLTDYISMRKMQESAYFVQHKDYDIADIAMLYGFSGQSYYITVFKKFIGMTPGEYRARY